VEVVDSVENIQQSYLNDTLPLSETLKVFGDICLAIENGAEINFKINSNFFYDAAKEVEDLEEDKIFVDCGDEVVVIDGELATRTIKSAVTEYVNKALEYYLDTVFGEDTK